MKLSSMRCSLKESYYYSYCNHFAKNDRCLWQFYLNENNLNLNKNRNMKQSNTLKVRRRNKVFAMIASFLFLMTQSTYVQAIVRISDIADIHYSLNIFVPIIAAFIFLCLTICRIFRIIAKSTFMRWTLSIVIAGSAFFVSSVIFKVI